MSRRFATQAAIGFLVTLLSALPCFGEPLKTASARLRMDGRQVMIWYPTEVKRALPLVLFSHGRGQPRVAALALKAILPSNLNLRNLSF